VRCTRCKHVFTVPVETELVFDDRLQSGLDVPASPAPPSIPTALPVPGPMRRPPSVQKPSGGKGWIIALVAGVAAVVLLVCGGGALAAWAFIAALTSGSASSSSKMIAKGPTPTASAPQAADQGPAPIAKAPDVPPGWQPPLVNPGPPNEAKPPDPIVFDRGDKPLTPPPPPKDKPKPPAAGKQPVIDFTAYAPKEAREEVPLGATVDDTAMGGGGRYWILHFAGKKKLAVFDVQLGKVAKEIPVAEEPVQFAAGATKLVIVYPNTKLVQIWNLSTFEKERSAPLPGSMTQDEIHQICMGSASDGPLFVYLPHEKRTLTMDLGSLDTTEVHWTQWAPNNAYGPLHMRASPDGRELVGWAGGWAGCAMATFEGAQQVDVQDKFEFSLGVFALPSADGRLIFTPWAIVKRDMTAAKSPDLKDAYLLPAEEPGFFLALRGGPGQGLPMAGYDRESAVSLGGVKAVDVYTEDRKKLFSLTDCPELADGSNVYWERCVHFYPREGLLAVLAGKDKDRVVLRRTNLSEQMDKLGLDYLFVLSRPPCAKASAAYSYKLDIRSNKGGVKVKLESGPDGLKVSPDGQVTWAVPSSMAGSDADVVVNVSDSSGQEMFHAFQVSVGAP
jgi:hypothetical protein